MSLVSSSFCSHDGAEDAEKGRDSKNPGLLQKYLKWLDDEPLKARCVTSAVIGACGALLGARTTPKSARLPSAIDWKEVVSFALHGGLIAGPLLHYLNEFLEDNFFDSRSTAVLFDQIVAQPPQLLLMFAFLDIAKAAIVSIPSAVGRSTSEIGSAVADSWKYWPLSIYVLLKLSKKRKTYVAAMNLCSVAWVAHLAKRRSTRSPHSNNIGH